MFGFFKHKRYFERSNGLFTPTISLAIATAIFLYWRIGIVQKQDLYQFSRL